MSDELIAICVPTYKRPELLRKCLTAIGKLNTLNNYLFNIVVVDNDSDASAKSLCDEFRDKMENSLHYFVEPERGLSSVRNRLLKEANRLHAGFIAFIDDDEQPGPDWLVKHMTAMHKYQADVCTGPVLATGSKYHSPQKVKDNGTTPRHVSTNNVVFKMKLVRLQELRFDAFYNFIGGEDFDFFERSKKLNNKHVWVEEALVYESIPESRDNLRYLFYRHFSGGINSIMRYKRSNPGWRAWLRFSPKIAGKLLGSFFNLLFGVLTINKTCIHSSIKKLANGLGYFAGLLNVVIERYRHIETEEFNNHKKQDD
jgi:glycosyltransferase involved in cell wall biosynthesis